MATRKKSTRKWKLEDLPAQEDPRAPLSAELLLRAAQPALKAMAADLLVRAKASAAVTTALQARHCEEKAAERTADPYDTWLRAFVEQVAAAWVLSCVFVRVLEDRGLVEQNRLAGLGALDSQQLFFELAPSLSERDYLLMVFRELSELPAASDLFDARHNPVWLLAPSAQGARSLLSLFRTPSPHAPALRFGQTDTRFLGDLYQDLSESVRKRYALLQTPDFIERFILDRTLERAIERFGLDETTLIDPTCGSGHFLLGSFERLFEHRLRNEPGLDVRQAAFKALDAVSGADINPYAIAIARFRLTLAYLHKAGHDNLAEAPQLPLHLVVADSLLHNPQRKLEHPKSIDKQVQTGFVEMESVERTYFERDLYSLEDEAAARDVLYRRYAAVVGNPPYITPKDPKRSKQYKRIYRTAVGAYHLSSPFLERFFQLAREQGSVGVITDNAFMKREYGRALVNEFLPTVNLDRIVNTSGAYVPGHGTPTVLLFGTAEPEQGDFVPTVLPKRGEPDTPAVAEDGRVWSSIAAHWDDVGYEDDFISVEQVDRPWLHRHPWVLAGGGAIELFKTIEAKTSKRLGDAVVAVGRTTHTGEDGFFFLSLDAARRLGVPGDGVVPLVKGEQVRDWAVASDEGSLFPYFASDASPREPREGGERRLYWAFRRLLKNRKDYGEHIEQRGLSWFEHSMFFPKRFLQPLGIAFAFVATHNHFALDRGGRLFNRSAPVIKLPEGATEDDHVALLAYLNSSTACFWMKQVFFEKGATSDRGVLQGDEDKLRYEFDATKLKALPIPSEKLLEVLVPLARQCDAQLADAGVSSYLDALRDRETASADVLIRWREIEIDHDARRRRAVALQEAIDWNVYVWLGLADQGLADPDQQTTDSDRRAFMSDSNEDKLSVQHRQREQIVRTSSLRILEDSVYKRRWYRSQGKFRAEAITDETLQLAALKEFLASSLEQAVGALPRPQSRRSLVMAQADILERASAVHAKLGSPNEDVAGFARSLLEAESVPFLAARRYTEPGLEKHAIWEETWTSQRREDEGEGVGEIAVPPKYIQTDFREGTYWRHRGKLDVPKERFISYPDCESDEDEEPLFGWAGWNHLEQAQALAQVYEQRKKNEGWGGDRLTPILAGVLELLPWIKQWHNDPGDEFDVRPGDYFESYLDNECAAHGLSRKDLSAWRPPQKRKSARKKKAS